MSKWSIPFTRRIDQQLADAEKTHHDLPVNYQWKLGKCKRCRSDVLRTYNGLFDIEDCLQCGSEIITFRSESEILYGLGHYRSPFNFDGW